MQSQFEECRAQGCFKNFQERQTKLQFSNCRKCSSDLWTPFLRWDYHVQQEFFFSQQSNMFDLPRSSSSSTVSTRCCQNMKRLLNPAHGWTTLRCKFKRKDLQQRLLMNNRAAKGRQGRQRQSLELDLITIH